MKGWNVMEGDKGGREKRRRKERGDRGFKSEHIIKGRDHVAMGSEQPRLHQHVDALTHYYYITAQYPSN